MSSLSQEVKQSSERATKTYKLSKNETSEKITAEAIWSLWEDVNNWPKWDKGLENCNLKGKFAVGQTFSLMPKGGKELTTKLLEVDTNKGFKDITEMPFGTIEVTHTVTPSGKGLTVTHSIVAKIWEDKVDLFEKTLWAKWQTGLQNSVQNIVNMAAENSSRNTNSSSSAKM